MSGCCSSGCSTKAVDPAFRRALWIALAVNASMFVVEMGGGLAAGSAALQADALDFLGDSANYIISLVVLSMASVWRTRAALVKGLSMGGFGLWVLGMTAWHAISGTLPAAGIMAWVAGAAFVANAGVAVMLYQFREGDANMRSVWLCSRNDAIGNLFVLGAASGVFASGTGWPDIVVAVVMAGLALQAAFLILRQVRLEMAPALP